jgi:predicted ATPase
MWYGWGLTEDGQEEEGIAQIRDGLVMYQAIGMKLGGPRIAVLLAGVYSKRGQVEEGLAVVSQGLEAANQTEERVDEAELYRLKGELTLQQFQVQGSKFQVENPQSVICNPQSEAEACFLKAIEIARKQQAKSLELRAVMSLSRLWQNQGKKDEAHKMLAETYGWFTEGLDTKDLQEAKALIEELS